MHAQDADLIEPALVRRHGPELLIAVGALMAIYFLMRILFGKRSDTAGLASAAERMPKIDASLRNKIRLDCLLPEAESQAGLCLAQPQWESVVQTLLRELGPGTLASLSLMAAQARTAQDLYQSFASDARLVDSFVQAIKTVPAIVPQAQQCLTTLCQGV